ncbi:hypothetical protein D3C73_910280 [compost metagenome]
MADVQTQNAENNAPYAYAVVSFKELLARASHSYRYRKEGLEPEEPETSEKEVRRPGYRGKGFPIEVKDQADNDPYDRQRNGNEQQQKFGKIPAHILVH